MGRRGKMNSILNEGVEEKGLKDGMKYKEIFLRGDLTFSLPGSALCGIKLWVTCGRLVADRLRVFERDKMWRLHKDKVV